MALPGHSTAAPFNGPRSPPRQFSGYPEHSAAHPIYGPQRPMPPPSPQHYPRYTSQPPPPPPASTALNYGLPQPPHKRPGSSMSISSMLGSESERQDPFYPNHNRTSSHGPSLPPSSIPSLGAVMSPPQYPPRTQEYSYKPRSSTPDRFGEQIQNRYRSGSGNLLQRPDPFPAPYNADRQPPGRYSEAPSFGPPMPARDEAAERARRTSLSGILQRPDSAPQRPSQNGHHAPPPTLPRPDSAAAIPSDPFTARKASLDRPEPPTSVYDTKPPPFGNKALPHKSNGPRKPFGPEKRESPSLSPELRRAQPNGEYRSFGSVLNDGPGSHNMARQESVQSVNSAAGDRYRPRAFSPFAPSVASQSMSVTSVPPEDRARKGSDEISHRAILGLANDSRRGRFSPVPQAVQGAQAQTPVPDAGVKAEQGRVFAGLGGGLGAGPSSTPVGLSSSPFKEGAARLSEENLMKMSRSQSGMGKRLRKFDEEPRAESDIGDAKKGRKRSKYAHAYKVDLEETARRGTPLSTALQRTGTPTHHHQMPRGVDPKPLFKPKKTVRISSIITAAKRKPRKHLGTFKYDPIVSQPDVSKPSPDKFDVGVKPNALPTFDDPNQINCTYSIRIPKLWLQDRERRMICREAFLWGSGIYTDDSDILAAAMHSGFLKSAPPENSDRPLLDRIVKDQNARIEGLIDVPDTPLHPETGKDALITCLVLPGLEIYPSTTRYGTRSRQWPEEERSGSAHDGASFAIIKVEFVSGGVEARRMGRTGKERRMRLKQEMEERRKGQERMKEMAEAVKGKVRKIGKVQRTKGGDSVRKEMAGKAALGSFKEKIRADEERQREKHRTEVVQPLDVGQAPGEWLKQLETSAVEA